MRTIYLFLGRMCWLMACRSYRGPGQFRKTFLFRHPAWRLRYCYRPLLMNGEEYESGEVRSPAVRVLNPFRFVRTILGTVNLPNPKWKWLQLKFDRLAGIRRDEFSGLVPTDQTPERVPPPMSERERIRLGIFR